MTELEKSKAIIKYIADSKKITPVKLYTNSEIKNSYDCKVFGEGKFKVIIGDWEIVQKIIDENIEHNQCDDGSDDDYTAHILKIVEKEKTRFKNVTMNAKNIYVFKVICLQKCLWFFHFLILKLPSI